MTALPTRSDAPRALPARAGAAPTAAAGITPREMLRIVRRRMWLIIITFCICLGSAIAAHFIWLAYAPLYTAEAYLKVEPPPASFFDRPGYVSTKDLLERYKRTVAQLAKNTTVLNAVTVNPDVRKTQWFDRNKDALLRELDDDVNVTPVPETDLIRISMTGTVPSDLSEIVNAVSRAFANLAGRDVTSGLQQDLEKLTKERDTLRVRRDEINRDIALARSSGDLSSMQQRRGAVDYRLEQVIREEGLVRQAVSMSESDLRAFQDMVKEGSIENHREVRQALDMSPEIRMLSGQLTELKTRLDSAAARFGEKHRSVVTLRDLIASAERQVSDKRKEITQAQIIGMQKEREERVGGTRQALGDVIQRIEAVNTERKDLEAALSRIDTRTREREQTEEDMRKLDAKIMDLRFRTGIRSDRPDEVTGPVTMYASAQPPQEPTYPRLSIMLPAGIVLGLVLGFGLAFLLELGDLTIKSPTDLSRRVHLPLLGMVPHADDLEEDVRDVRRLVLDMPHSPASEAFRQIRTNLLFSAPAQQRRSLLVTSPAPEDGRTTVVMNLAASMALNGRRVLVVDANFRQPAVAAMYPAAPPAGLSSALVGQAQWRDAVLATDVPNLSVMAAGPMPPNPGELLGSDAMRQLIADMTNDYDEVLFDGSPITVVSDAVVLSTLVDGVVLVVRAGVNSVGIVQRAAEQLARVGGKVLGIVLQGVRVTAGGYLRKNYQAFYDYQRSLPK